MILQPPERHIKKIILNEFKLNEFKPKREKEVKKKKLLLPHLNEKLLMLIKAFPTIIAFSKFLPLNCFVSTVFKLI